MNGPVEIVTLESGVRQSLRVLSQREEQRLGGYAASLAAGASAAGFAGFALLTWLSGFVLHAPLFFATASAGVVAAGGWAWRRAAKRLSHYRVGPRVDDDAFASDSVDLVRPAAHGRYELALVHGMTGVVEEGGLRRPIEGMTRRERPVWLPVVPGMLARVEMGQTTFIVRGLLAAESEASLTATAPKLALPGLTPKGFVHTAIAITVAAATLPLSTAVAAPVKLASADLTSHIPAQASPLEVQKLVYKAVQAQAGKLYACFEPFPPQCALSGYVGVGLKLRKNGDVASHWLSRSTYGAGCPAAACVQDVIANLFFDEMPEALSIVVPVQVLENPMATRALRVQIGDTSVGAHDGSAAR